MPPQCRLPSFILLVLLAACGEPQQVVLVHASDPHLLDHKRADQARLNDDAWQAMFGAVRSGAAGPAPRYLVITGDFGLEATDPCLNVMDQPRPRANAGQDAGPASGAEAEAEAGPGERTDPGEEEQGAPAAASGAELCPAVRLTPQSSVRADSVRRELAARVARTIKGSSFDSVFFVPGNNDVFLENADPAAWREVGSFVKAVNDSLEGKELIDLTACYRTAGECAVPIDTPYVLVGFPSVALKNAGVSVGEFREYLDTDTTRFKSAMRERAERHDRIHQRLMGEFANAVQAAGDRGRRRVIVVTHIPDLDDPYSVGQVRAKVPLKEFPRVSDDSLNAWNASNSVFTQWKAVVGSPPVVGVLAGHFHDSHRQVYYRPYTWSRSANRSDRWRTYVTPPLSIKMQEASPIQARGFSVLTLQGESVRRRLHWYDPDARTFRADSSDEPSPPGAASSATGGSRRDRFNPWQSAGHMAVFLIVVLAAGLAAILWPADPAASQPDAVKTPARLARDRREVARALAVSAFAGALAVLIVQIGWGLRAAIWPFAAFWFIALFAMLALAQAVIKPMLRAKRNADDGYGY